MANGGKKISRMTAVGLFLLTKAFYKSSPPPSPSSATTGTTQPQAGMDTTSWMVVVVASFAKRQIAWR
jgi:hypothetical protein